MHHLRNLHQLGLTILDGPSPETVAATTISVHGLTKSYGSVKALRNVDLTVQPGEFLTLLGPSGSGKTTLLMAIAGFCRPTAGSIRIGGQDVVAVPPHRRDIGVVFQNYALFPHLDVLGNVAYPLRVRGVRKAVAAEQAYAALALVRLTDYAGRRVDELSGGQRQRVALARAVGFGPQLLLMDEPLSALDKTLREEMQIEIRQLQRALGITTISVTHDQREALTMADRVAVFDAGRIVQLDTPELLYAVPRTSFVAQFMGETTLLRASLRQGTPFLLGRPVRTRHGIPAGAGDCNIVLRAERLALFDGADQPGYNIYPATIENRVFQGDSLLVRLSLEDGSMVLVRQPVPGVGHADLSRPGARVHVGLHEADAVLVPVDQT